jgi:hypothetical protein
VQGFLDRLTQLILVVANPLWQDVIDDTPVVGIALFHSEHDAVAPVITYIYRKERIGVAGYAAEVELFKTVVDLDQLGEMDVLGEM